MFRSSLIFPVCNCCQEALSPIQAEHRCVVCSVPLISELRCCTRCSMRNFSFASNFSLYEYRGLVRQIISQFKFSNRRSLAPFVARLLCPELKTRHGGLAVVPVPGSRRSVRRRGWDPMIEAARALQRICAVEVLLLLKRRRGGPQKGLHYQDRVENIRGTIELCATGRTAGNIPERVVLIDDIFTSGATSDECARVLQQAGVRQVHVLTLAVEV
ncbi:MAG: ComF family protein [Spirochaetaceae bacterium]|nr:MAG: ComF family protein [Spirochaetaceae bacterium]